MAAVLGLAGCVSARPAAHPSGTSPAPPGTEVVDLATRSGAWPASQHLFDAAVSRLAHRCLAAHGFNDPDVAQPPLPSPQDEAAAIDMPARRRHGYGLIPDSSGSSSAPPQDPYYAQLSPQDKQRFDTALFGPATDTVSVDVGGGQTVGTRGQGCEADARRTIAGDLAVWARIFYAPDQYANRLSEQASQSPAYLGAVALWRSCMADRGYRYQTPDGAYNAMRDLYRQAGATPRFRQEQIAVAVAVADGECAGHAHLPSTALAVQRSLVAALPAADRAALAQLVSRRDQAVRRAAAVMGIP